MHQNVIFQKLKRTLLQISTPENNPDPSVPTLDATRLTWLSIPKINSNSNSSPIVSFSFQKPPVRQRTLRLTNHYRPRVCLLLPRILDHWKSRNWFPSTHQAYLHICWYAFQSNSLELTRAQGEHVFRSSRPVMQACYTPVRMENECWTLRRYWKVLMCDLGSMLDLILSCWSFDEDFNDAPVAFEERNWWHPSLWRCRVDAFYSWGRSALLGILRTLHGDCLTNGGWLIDSPLKERIYSLFLAVLEHLTGRRIDVKSYDERIRFLRPCLQQKQWIVHWPCPQQNSCFTWADENQIVDVDLIVKLSCRSISEKVLVKLMTIDLRSVKVDLRQIQWWPLWPTNGLRGAAFFLTLSFIVHYAITVPQLGWRWWLL